MNDLINKKERPSKEQDKRDIQMKLIEKKLILQSKK